MVLGMSLPTFTLRAFVFDERDLQALPPPPPSPRIGNVNVASDRMTEVTWAPVSGDVDGYEIEVWTGDQFVHAATANANETSALVFWPLTAQYRVRAFNAGGLSPESPAPAASRRRSIRP